MSRVVDARLVNIHELCEKKHVEEVEEVVGEWNFLINRCPIILKIKVVKTTQPPDMYVGLTNYKIKPSRQSGPYMSIYPKDTVKEALEDALKGFLSRYNPEQAKETKYIPYEQW